MPAPNPYTPSRVTTPGQDEQLVRKAKEPVRTAVFTAMFVFLVVLCTFFIGGLAGILIAGIGSGLLVTLYRITTRTPKMLNPAHTAGTIACPHCGSMQTDQRLEPGQALVWACFACNETWPATA